jgi:hypothetical protein
MCFKPTNSAELTSLLTEWTKPYRAKMDVHHLRAMRTPRVSYPGQIRSRRVDRSLLMNYLTSVSLVKEILDADDSVSVRF